MFSNGIFTLLVSNKNAPRCAFGDTIEVSYDAICVSVDEKFAAQTNVSYFPNPTNGLISAKIEGFENLEVQMRIVSMRGQVVRQKTWNVNDAIYEDSIDLSLESDGIYFIHLSTKSGSVVHRISLNK